MTNPSDGRTAPESEKNSLVGAAEVQIDSAPPTTEASLKDRFEPQDLPRNSDVGANGQWMKIVGAVFAAILLVSFLFLGGFAAIRQDIAFGCAAFSFLAPAFAIGTAMSASFIGGGAAVSGDLGEQAQRKPLRISIVGGVAVLLIMFLLFFALKPADCEPNEQAEIQFQHIPKGHTTIPGGEFWVRETANPNDAERLDLSVLVKGYVDNGLLRINQGNEEVCSVEISFKPSFGARNHEQFSYYDLNVKSPLKLRFVPLKRKLALHTSHECFVVGDDLVPGKLENRN